MGRYPSGQRGQTVNLMVHAYEGSNPSLPTKFAEGEFDPEKTTNRSFRRTSSMSKNVLWYVYILECKDKKLYTGITKNLNLRIERHNKGLACKFTKYRRPVKLVYKEAHSTKSEARKIELRIKGYSRERKLKLASE